MRLCLKAGKLKWREEVAKLDSDELTEWMIFEGMEPFGDEWRPIARLCAVVANMFSKERLTEEQFMPLVKVAPVNARDEILAGFRSVKERQWR